MKNSMTKLITLSLATLTATALVACSAAPPVEDEEPGASGESLETEPAEAEAEPVEAEEHHGEHHGEHRGHHDHRFDDPERYAERWNDPARDEWQNPRAVVEAMEIEPGMTVADLGAGTGYFIPYLSEAVGPEGTVLAVDIEEAMLGYIEGQATEYGWENVETVQARADDSGLPEGAVDRILTVNTWHHIPNRPSYSAHLLERLTDQGSVWVVDYHVDSPAGPPPEHRLAPEEVIEELEAGGFDAELHPLELPRQFLVVGRP